MFESGVGNTLPSLELVSKLVSEKGTVPTMGRGAAHGALLRGLRKIGTVPDEF